MQQQEQHSMCLHGRCVHARTGFTQVAVSIDAGCRLRAQSLSDFAYRERLLAGEQVLAQTSHTLQLLHRSQPQLLANGSAIHIHKQSQQSDAMAIKAPDCNFTEQSQQLNNSNEDDDVNELWKLRDQLVSTQLTNETQRRSRWPDSSCELGFHMAPIDTNAAACQQLAHKSALLDDMKFASDSASSSDKKHAAGACNTIALTALQPPPAFANDFTPLQLDVPRSDAQDESFSDSEINNVNVFVSVNVNGNGDKKTRSVVYDSDATASSSGKYSANDAGVQLSTTSSSVNSNALQHCEPTLLCNQQDQQLLLSNNLPASTTFSPASTISTNTDSLSVSPDTDTQTLNERPYRNGQSVCESTIPVHSLSEAASASDCTPVVQPRASTSAALTATMSVPLNSGAKAAYGNFNASNIQESLLESIQNEIYACRRTLIESKKLRMWTYSSASVPTEDDGGITVAASAAAAYAAATAAAVVSSVRRKKLVTCESAPPTVSSDMPAQNTDVPKRRPLSTIHTSSSQSDRASGTFTSSTSQVNNSTPSSLNNNDPTLDKANDNNSINGKSNNNNNDSNNKTSNNNKDALCGVGDAVSFGMLRSSYWSFTKRSLRRPLLNIEDAKFESLALQMFDAILQYCGVKANVGGSASTLQTRSTKDADRYELVQLLVQHCLADENICNEFYLQLIKETTDNPDNGGAVSINNWHLLAVVCGIVPPCDVQISKYLDAHLRKMCIVKAYPDESKAAQKALKFLTLATSKPRRKCPPSCKEVIAVISRKPVCENVYLLDGRKVAVELVPHLTASQVCSQVKTQIGMQQSARGFALFETCHSYERAMHADTYLCDSLFIWEQNAKRRRTIRDVRYLFKKKLLIEPIMNVADATECDLVYNQVINDVFDCRIPVTTDTLINLCAYIAQAEYGDATNFSATTAGASNSEVTMNASTISKTSTSTSDGRCDYLSTMRIVPRDMRHQVSTDAIEASHRALAGMTALEAKLKSIELMKDWPLFGSKLFIVMQENSILTRTFYLAVNKTGIHFLQTASSNSLTPAQTPFASYNFGQIVSCTPEPESLTLTARGQYNPIEKNTFRTYFAYQIADLVSDYINELKGIMQRTRTMRSTSKKRTRSRTSSDRSKARPLSSDLTVLT